MSVSDHPDLAGFRQAQNKLREETGQDVVLLIPEEATWPPGTQLDPETHRPYDPTVVPLSSGFASASARVGVAWTALSRTGSSNATDLSPLGITEQSHAMLIVGSGDVANFELAEDVIVFDERWKIQGIKPDGVGNVIHRWLAYLKHR